MVFTSYLSWWILEKSLRREMVSYSTLDYGPLQQPAARSVHWMHAGRPEWISKTHGLITSVNGVKEILLYLFYYLTFGKAIWPRKLACPWYHKGFVCMSQESSFCITSPTLAFGFCSRHIFHKETKLLCGSSRFTVNSIRNTDKQICI